MPNDIIKDLEEIDRIEKLVDSLSNDNEKTALLNSILTITDKYSLDPDPKCRHSGILEDIHLLAGKKADIALKLTKIYESEYHQSVEQKNPEKEKLLEKKIRDLHQIIERANIKSIEPVKKYD